MMLHYSSSQHECSYTLVSCVAPSVAGRSNWTAARPWLMLHSNQSQPQKVQISLGLMLHDSLQQSWPSHKLLHACTLLALVSARLQGLQGHELPTSVVGKAADASVTPASPSRQQKALTLITYCMFCRSACTHELALTQACLQENPKSYSTWHHRKWVVLKGLADLNAELKLVSR